MIVEVNELMVGDYIYGACGCSKIKHIHDDLEDSYVVLEQDGEIITPENINGVEIDKIFLEENGFVYATPEEQTPAWEKEADAYLSGEHFKIEITEYQRYDHHFGHLLIYGKEGKSAVEKDVKYVHELQHALKLLGIKDDLNAFL